MYDDKENLQEKLKRLSDELVEIIYPLTFKFPHIERFALADQIRRASISIPTNIIEGLARETDREKKRFMVVAKSSLAELRYEITFAKRRGYLDAKNSALIETKSERLSQLLGAFIKTLKRFA